MHSAPQRKLLSSAPRAVVPTVARGAVRALGRWGAFAAFLASFLAVFFPARSAHALGTLDSVSPLVGFCDVLGATGLAPAAPLVLAQDEDVLVASALAAGISDPRGASMNAPLSFVPLSDDSIAALEDFRCERSPSALPVVEDDHPQGPSAAPPMDLDPALPSSFAVFVGFPALLPSTFQITSDDVMLPGHARGVEHPPRLGIRVCVARARLVPWLGPGVGLGCTRRGRSGAAPRRPQARPASRGMAGGLWALCGFDLARRRVALGCSLGQRVETRAGQRIYLQSP